MIKAVLFEIDDVLYDAETFYDGAFRTLAEDIATRHGGASEPLVTRLRSLGESMGWSDPRLLDVFSTQEQLPEEELDRMMVHLQRHRPVLELRPDTVEMIERTPPGVQLGVVTEGDSMVQRNKVRALELTARFHPIIFTGDFGVAWRRPSPLPYRAACHALGLGPGQIVYVGNQARADAVGPHRIDMSAVRLDRGPGTLHRPLEETCFHAEIRSLASLWDEGFVDRVLGAQAC